MQKVTPGTNPNVDISHFTPDEHDIIESLAREWYVTNGGREVIISTSTYRYILMKPTSNYTQLFNIEREIVVLFSPYERFEPRTLDAFTHVERAIQVHRLERICMVLISKDPEIEQAIRRILKSNEETRIVVPFRYDELQTISSDLFLRNRFRDYFYARDLFAFESPLRTDLYFFGRTNLVHEIVNRHKTNENSGLFGLRKTGKTSVIYGVKRALERDSERAVIVDCQNPSFHQSRWHGALYYVVQEARDQLKTKAKLSTELHYAPEKAAKSFESDMLKLRENNAGKSILLIFDEIENITFGVSPSSHWRIENDSLLFWQTLRSVFQKHQSLLTYLVVGTNPLCVETPYIEKSDNPIYNQIPYQYIERFDVPQTREMVRTLGRIMGLKFDETIYAKLTEDYGGHPFLIRHVCSVLNRQLTDERPVQVDTDDYRRAKEEFDRDYANYIEMVISVLKEHYPDEFEMMELLACDEEAKFTELAEGEPAWVSHLLGYGVLEKNRHKYLFRIDAVKSYLRRKNKYRTALHTDEERWHEIGERRNRLEKDLRQIVRTQLLAQKGREEGSKILLQIFGSIREAKARPLSFDEMFDPRKNELYLEDIRKVITKYWELFSNIFAKDKDEFNYWLKQINKYRSDAHAKPISPDEMAHLRVCFDKVEQLTGDFLGSNK